MTPAEEKPAKHATAAEAIEVLRARATNLAVRCLNPQKMTARGWKPKRPIDQERQSAELDTTCTCIELLTVNGSYFWERCAAIERAKAL